MAIIKKELGNRPDIIEKAFREHFSDGLGGIRFDAFCHGWKAAWQERQAENETLKNKIEFLRKRYPEIDEMEEALKG